MCEDQEKVLLPFQSPCCIQIVGPTQSGKTMLTYKILAQSEYLFTKTPKKTIYCYSAYQDLFSEMERKIENITFHEGLPTSEEIDKWSENKEHMILCLDDLLCQAANSSDVLNLFTVKSHHCNISVLFLMQNLFPPGKCIRTISLNATYIICLKNQRDKHQLSVLGRQILPGQLDYFMSAYEKAVSLIYGYIIIDLSTQTDKKYLLRTKIFKGEDPVIFVPK